METKVKIAISNRHVHLTKEVYDMLFDEELEVDRMLGQIGQFASKQRVTIKTADGQFENVRVLGPLRKYNQVEVSRKDSLTLKLNPPVRASGDLDGAAEITIETPKASVTLPCCILAQRHVHMSPADAEKFGVKNGDKLQLRVDGDRSATLDLYAKVSDDGYFEVHIDTDEANALVLNQNEEGTLII